jgi:peptide/nickel transport system permease protein
MTPSGGEGFGTVEPTIIGPPGAVPPNPLLEPDTGMPAVQEPRARSQWDLTVRRFVRHRLAMVSLGVLVLLYVVVSFPHLFAPYALNPKNLPLSAANQPPSLKHLFGTDELGRDQTTRIMYAAHVSMTIGLMVAICSTLIGTLVGAVAGYFGGWIDQLLMRITDLFLVVPGIAVIATAMQGLSSRSFPVVGRVSTVTLIIAVMSVLFWQTIARVVRGLFLSIKEKEFVDAARATGASSWRIMFRHILPNVVGPIVVNATLVVAGAILLESALSFLGFGVRPPAVSLGSMLSQSESAIGTSTAYLIYYPGLALLVIVLAVNFLGDGLRDALDPQSDRH